MARAAALAAGLVGLVTLVGWQLRTPAWTSFGPGRVAITPWACVSLIAQALALALLSCAPDRRRDLGACVVAVASAIVPVLVVVEFGTGFDIGVDAALMRGELVRTGEVHQGRMALDTAVAHLAIAAALVIVRRRPRASQALAFAAGVLALAGVVRHVYGVFVADAMAIPTALAMTGLAVGAFALRPDAGALARLRSSTPGGNLLRRIGPIVVLLPLALDVVVAAGVQHGWFGLALGSSFRCVVTAASLAALAAFAARSLDRVEAGRARLAVAEAARASELRKASIVENALDCIVSIDASGRIVEWNPSAERTFGYAREDVLGKPLAELIIPARLRAAHEAGFRRHVATGERRILGRRVEMPAVRADGTELPVELSVVRIDGAGETTFTAHLRDVTEAHRADEEKRRLAAIVESTENAVYSKALDGTVLTWNRSAERIYGWRADEIIGRSILLLAPADRIEEERSLLARIGRGESIGGFETERQRKDGQRVEVSLSISPLRDREGNVCATSTIACDISERKRAERAERFLAACAQKLLESIEYEATLGAVVKLAIPELADWCTVFLDDDGRITEVAQAHGDAPNGGLARQLLQHDFVRSRDPDDLRIVTPLELAQLVPRVDDAVLRAIATDEAHLARLRAVGLGSYLTAPLRVRERQLGVLYLARSTRRPPLDAADLSVASELAERIALAIDNARLYRATQEAVRAREEFMAIAAHELRTPLTSLQFGVQDLRRILGDPAPTPAARTRAATMASVLDRSTQRLAKLVEEMLDVTRVEAGAGVFRLEDLDLGGLVQGVVERSRSVLAGARCEVDLRVDGPLVGRWDRAAMERVVTNLLSNAVKYGAGRPIELRVEGDAARARLVVRDHGIGIPREEQARIFGRFERAVSARSYGGFGLGLWIVRRTVDALGGSVRVESEPGAGATFTVELPLQGAAERAGAPGGDGSAASLH